MFHRAVQLLLSGGMGQRGAEMSKLLRGIAAGWGASRLGGGCLSTVLIFVLLWWLLGYCGIFQ